MLLVSPEYLSTLLVSMSIPEPTFNNLATLMRSTFRMKGNFMKILENLMDNYK